MITIPGLETYFGGKGASGTYQKIINQLPPHDVYIEPFLGAGNIMRRKKPAEFLNWGMDLDQTLIDQWLSIPHDENVKISVGCGISLLKSFARGDVFNHDIFLPEQTIFIYIDPPYLFETRKDKRKRYNYELSDGQHQIILRSITDINNDADRTNIFIGISGLYSKLYQEYLNGWRCITFWNQTRHGQQLEHLWMNYPEPKELHQYNYLGDDYREREKIQNQIRRNVERLERMNPLLRNAIVSAIKEKY